MCRSVNDYTSFSEQNNVCFTLLCKFSEFFFFSVSNKVNKSLPGLGCGVPVGRYPLMVDVKIPAKRADGILFIGSNAICDASTRGARGIAADGGMTNGGDMAISFGGAGGRGADVGGAVVADGRVPDTGAGLTGDGVTVGGVCIGSGAVGNGAVCSVFDLLRLFYNQKYSPSIFK